MPVLVTGAEQGAGSAVVARLRSAGGEVRAYVDAETTPDAVERLRGAGVKVARGALEDEGRLELALEQVHTVVHAAGGPLDDPDTLLDELASVVSAALGAGCRRLVWASHLGATDPQGNPYLAACAEGEALLVEAPIETVVLRRALTYGPRDALTAALAAADLRGTARHAPLFVGDLAGAVLAADAERGQSSAAHVVVELAGPEVVTVDELVAALAAAHAGGPSWPPLPAHVVDLLRRDQLPGPDALGRTGTPLQQGLSELRASVRRGR